MKYITLCTSNCNIKQKFQIASKTVKKIGKRKLNHLKLN